MWGSSNSKSEDDGDTSYNDEKATPIVPPDACLRLTLLSGTTDGLTDAEKAAVEALQADADKMADEFEYDEWKRAWLDTACMIRHLKARDWNVDEASTLLRVGLKWRDERKVWNIRSDHKDALHLETRTGKTYRHGLDKLGRPIVYFRDRRQNTKDYFQQVNGVINTFERAIETMDVTKNVEQWCLIFDFNGYAMSNAPPMHVSREILSIMLTCYPERLGVAIFYDAPWLFNIFWRAISVFVPVQTRAKVIFVSGSADEKRAQLAAIVDLSVLEHPFGGDNDCRFVHKLYWAKEDEEHQKYIAHVESLVKKGDDVDAADTGTATTSTRTKSRRRKKK